MDKYIDLLEKAFVVFRLPAFSRNVRNEIKKGEKIYCYDCGIRNAVMNSFKPLSSRGDAGALWENYFIAERLKFLPYHQIDADLYLWRTTQKQEMDLIEETEDGLPVFALKWNKKKAVQFLTAFVNNYPGAQFNHVSSNDMEDYLFEF